MLQTKLAIIGSGPSGYTAGVYAARAMLKPVLYAGFQSGGQLMNTTDIENYPGFKDGVDGPLLMLTMREQALRFGTDIQDLYVVAVDFSERPFKLWTTLPASVPYETYVKATGEELARLMTEIRQQEPDCVADSVIVSTGATSIMLGVPGEDSFWGRGVSTCAVCDAAFYREKNTFVIGGGDSAMEDTLALTKFAKSVTVLHRRDAFRASKIMQDRVLNHPKVTVKWNTQVEEILGGDHVEKIRLNENGQVSEVPADGVFIAIGHKPQTQIFAGQLAIDPHGYLVTRQSASQAGLELAQTAINDKGLLDFPSMTSVAGVFGAGDVVDVRYKQAVTAAGQGCSAALDAERWLEAR